ncbi:MAG: hypothetical protein FVQ79_07465 [Planctomycetes bacterium]|nr:hypothetical protein [Planctomycetota bacterium]
MEFVGIIGDRGSGKTNLMTKLLYLHHLSGENIIANYTLHFPANLMSFTEVAKLGPEIQSAYIGLDELSEGADSYEFFEKNVRRVTRLISQIRKRECRVYYTDQRLNKIAKRLRQQTDGFILMRDLDKGKAGHNFDNCESVFECTFLTDTLAVVKTVLFNGKDSQHLYNSKEIITGFDTPVLTETES